MVKVAAVNCEQQQGLCQQYGIRGYPTIRAMRWACSQGIALCASYGCFFRGGGSAHCPAPLLGMLDLFPHCWARHLKDWALSLLPKHIKSVHKEAQLVRSRFALPGCLSIQCTATQPAARCDEGLPECAQ